MFGPWRAAGFGNKPRVQRLVGGTGPIYTEKSQMYKHLGEVGAALHAGNFYPVADVPRATATAYVPGWSVGNKAVPSGSTATGRA